MVWRLIFKEIIIIISLFKMDFLKKIALNIFIDLR